MIIKTDNKTDATRVAKILVNSDKLIFLQDDITLIIENDALCSLDMIPSKDDYCNMECQECLEKTLSTIKGVVINFIT